MFAIVNVGPINIQWDALFLIFLLSPHFSFQRTKTTQAKWSKSVSMGKSSFSSTHLTTKPNPLG